MLWYRYVIYSFEIGFRQDYIYCLDSCQMDETCLMTSNQETDNSHEERLSQPRLTLS
jgi:hypothetical protein